MSTKLEKAARVFAKAWAEWHEHDCSTFDPELIDAGHGIVEALGLEMVQVTGGKQKLVKVLRKKATNLKPRSRHNAA